MENLCGISDAAFDPDQSPMHSAAQYDHLGDAGLGTGPLKPQTGVSGWSKRSRCSEATSWPPYERAPAHPNAGSKLPLMGVWSRYAGLRRKPREPRPEINLLPGGVFIRETPVTFGTPLKEQEFRFYIKFVMTARLSVATPTWYRSGSGPR
jgi:hypothetical protein